MIKLISLALLLAAGLNLSRAQSDPKLSEEQHLELRAKLKDACCFYGASLKDYAAFRDCYTKGKPPARAHELYDACRQYFEKINGVAEEGLLGACLTNGGTNGDTDALSECIFERRMGDDKSQAKLDNLYKYTMDGVNGCIETLKPKCGCGN